MKKIPSVLKKIVALTKNLLLMAIILYAVTLFQQRNLLPTDHTPAPYFNLATLDNPQQRVTIADLKGTVFVATVCLISKKPINKAS